MRVPRSAQDAIDSALEDVTELAASELNDEPAAWRVVNHAEQMQGHVFSLVVDEVATPSGQRMTREFISHPGAVAVIALDATERVVLVRQYRHPVRHLLLEPPAGLLDVSGESWLTAAQRELAEEVGLEAREWQVLVDVFTSPGMGSEALRVFLARDLRPTHRPDGFVPEGEEAEMETVLARLDDLAGAVLDGRLGNPALCVGVLATLAARQRGFDRLRPPDAPWRAKES